MYEAGAKRLLKAEDLRHAPSGSTPVAYNYDDIQRLCDEHLEQVRQQARQLILDADAEATSLRETTLEAARQEGLARGLAEAEQQVDARIREHAARLVEEQLQTALPAVEELTRLLDEERDRWLADWETAAVRLSTAIAGRILRQQLEAQPERVRETVAGALEMAAGMPELRILVHPLDLEILQPFAEKLLAGLASRATVELAADQNITRGGCRIETGYGEIDARLETQLERIAEELLQQGL